MGFLVWTLVGANTLMLTLAYAFDDKPTLEWQTAAAALGATAIASALGAAGVYLSASGSQAGIQAGLGGFG